MSTPVNIQIGYKTVAWFSANPTIILLAGQHIYLSDGAHEFVDAYVIGDGTTQLQNLIWKGLLPTSKYFTVSGNTVTLTDSDPENAQYFLNGVKCKIGQRFITSIVGTLVALDDDYTNSDFEALY